MKLDRGLLYLSSITAEPFCFTWHLCAYRFFSPLDPKKFENLSTIIEEVAFRTLIGVGCAVGAVAAIAFPVPVVSGVLSLGVMSRALRWLGFAFQTGQCTYVAGTGAEKSISHGSLKLMAWNVCGMGGGLSLDHGGVIHWRDRFDQIIEVIRKEDPDVLILQEIYDALLAERIIETLKGEYAHFFLHLGSNSIGIGSGVMILSKCPVHEFRFASFAVGEIPKMNRGFAEIVVKKDGKENTPFVRLIGTHLHHGSGEVNDQIRMCQVAQLVHDVAQKTLKIPTVVAGDWNIEKESSVGRSLDGYFEHGYQGEDPTCTNLLTEQWDQKKCAVPGERIDYISLLKDDQAKRVSLEDVRLVKAFDDVYDTKTALSDHHGLVATIRSRAYGN